MSKRVCESVCVCECVSVCICVCACVCLCESLPFVRGDTPTREVGRHRQEDEEGVGMLRHQGDAQPAQQLEEVVRGGHLVMVCVCVREFVSVCVCVSSSSKR